MGIQARKPQPSLLGWSLLIPRCCQGAAWRYSLPVKTCDVPAAARAPALTPRLRREPRQAPPRRRAGHAGDRLPRARGAYARVMSRCVCACACACACVCKTYAVVPRGPDADQRPVWVWVDGRAAGLARPSGKHRPRGMARGAARDRRALLTAGSSPPSPPQQQLSAPLAEAFGKEPGPAGATRGITLTRRSSRKAACAPGWLALPATQGGRGWPPTRSF